LGQFTRIYKSTSYRPNDVTKEVFGGDFERHQHLSFGDQLCNQLGTTLEDCAKNQKINFQIG